jgi:osmotically inducible lipoprotein OsmB
MYKLQTMKKATPALLAIVLASSFMCACQRQDVGMAAGGVVGGLAGNAITGGSTAGTVVGAVGGAFVGRELSR